MLPAQEPEIYTKDVYKLMNEDFSQERMWWAYQRSNSFAKEITYQDVIKTILVVGKLIKV